MPRLTKLSAPFPCFFGMPAAPASSTGLVFRKDGRGGRSSSTAGKHILARALDALGAFSSAQATRDEKRWRQLYPHPITHWVEGALLRPQAVVPSAEAGLAAAWEALAWVGDDGVERPLADAVAAPEGWPLATFTLQGEGAAAVQPWQVPYRGTTLQGEALLQQLLRWVEAGVLEASAAKALGRCVRHPEWFDLSDRHIALLGAGSEAGPLRWLAQWRANLVAIDLDRPAVWTRIAEVVRTGNATLQVPLRGPAGGDWTRQAGVDLLRDAPRAAAWLRGFERPLDVGAFAYADGERHLRLSVAMDLVVQSVLEAQPTSSVAYLATPSDVFPVPEPSARFAQRRHQARRGPLRWGQEALRVLTRGALFRPHYPELSELPDGRRLGVSDSLVLQQGPNYAVAKRLQMWRALVARDRGHRVSLNVAPGTGTHSVMKNPALAAGYRGASAFQVEVFEPETTNALMAALWVHDLRTDRGPSDPHVPLGHPLDLVMDQACHGGLWTTAFRPRSVLPMAAVLGWWRKG